MFRDRPRLGPGSGGGGGDGFDGGGGSHDNANDEVGADDPKDEDGEDIDEGDDKASEIICVADDFGRAPTTRGQAFGAAIVVMVEHRPCRTIVNVSGTTEEEEEDDEVDAKGSGSSSIWIPYSHPCAPRTSFPKATTELLVRERCVGWDKAGSWRF